MLLACSLSVTGCSERSSSGPPDIDGLEGLLPQGFAQARLPEKPEHFVLESVDGQPPARNFNGGGPYRLTISRRRALYDGCNHAPYVIAEWDVSFAAMAGPQTLAGCSGSPDDAVQAVIESEPSIGRDGSGRLALVTRAHRLVLQPAEPRRPPGEPEDQDRIALAGTRFDRLVMKQGTTPPEGAFGSADFGRDGILRIGYGCPDVLRVRYRLESRRLRLAAPVRRACEKAEPERLDNIVEILSAPEAAIGWSDWGSTLVPGIPDLVLIANRHGTLVLFDGQAAGAHEAKR